MTELYRRERVNNMQIDNIQKHYGIVFPHEYLEFQQQADGQAFDMIENGEVVDGKFASLLSMISSLRITSIWLTM